MEEGGDNKEYCFSSNDPVPRIDTLLTTFVEGIGYLENHPHKKDGCFYLLEELLARIQTIASEKGGILAEHVEGMKRALEDLKKELNDKNYQHLREASLKLQNDLFRL